MQTPKMLLPILVFISSTACAQTAGGDGLTAAPRWQGRVVLGTAPSLNALGNATSAGEKWAGASIANGGATVRSLSVLGDYYFGGRLSSSTALDTPGDLLGGGFRATSGLLLGPRSGTYALPNVFGYSRPFSVDLRSAFLPSADSAATESNAVPYLGVGYTGISVKGGWGFSADVGVMALNPGSAVKLGRVVGGGQSLDDVLRAMRVSPLLQLGVSYSF